MKLVFYSSEILVKVLDKSQDYRKEWNSYKKSDKSKKMFGNKKYDKCDEYRKMNIR